MAQNRVAGTLAFLIDGENYLAKGNFTYNLGTPKREVVAGSGSIHGYTENPQPGMIDGEITVPRGMDVAAFCRLDGVTLTLQLATGDVVSLPNAWFNGDGNVNTEQGNMPISFRNAEGGRKLNGQ